MKKVIYTLLLVAASALTFTACSEEEVKPSTELENSGVSNSDKV